MTDRYRRRLEIRRDEVMGMQPALALAAGIGGVCAVVLVPMTALLLWALGRAPGDVVSMGGLFAIAAIWVGFWLGLSGGLVAGFVLAVRAWDAWYPLVLSRRDAREARRAVAEAEAMLSGRRQAR